MDKVVFQEGFGEYTKEYIYDVVEKGGTQYLLRYKINDISDIYSNSRYAFIKLCPFFPDIDTFEHNGYIYIGVEYLPNKIPGDIGEIDIKGFVNQCISHNFYPDCNRLNFRIDSRKITRENPYGIVYIDRDMLDFAMQGAKGSELLVSKTI